MNVKTQRSEMFYAEPIYRPPSEAHSLLIQATVGCSSAAKGRCHFCNSTVFNRMIPAKQFRIRPTEDILADIAIAREQYGHWVEKIFLLDSNALVIRTAELLKILDECYAVFPRLRQVSCYACAEDLLRKSGQELSELQKAGLTLIFVGLESGDQEVLDLVNKGVTVQDQIDAVIKANDAGIQTSVTVILGLGGKQLSEQHAVQTGRTVSAMNPTYLAALTLMVVPGTILYDKVQKGEFTPLTEQYDYLYELELMIMNIHAQGPVVFRTNHASNYLALRGILPHDQKNMLESIRYAVQNPDQLRKAHRRGL